MNYQEWGQEVFPEIIGDSLWKMEVYRLALFAADIGWHDVSKLMNDKRTIKLSDQLYRALGSIGANVSEGYSRGTGKDRAHFYEYALGSARESRGWYFNARHILGKDVVQHASTFSPKLFAFCSPWCRNKEAKFCAKPKLCTS